MTQHYRIVLALITVNGGNLAACARGQEVATLKHDFGGPKTLLSFPAVPTTQRRAGEQIATKLYGEMGIRSPRTPYICVWRNTDPTRFRAAANAGLPKAIFLSCNFGTEAWEPPANLIKAAEQAMTREEATVRFGWTRSGSRYKLNRVEIEIRGSKESFSSRWFGDEVFLLKFKRNYITFPKSPSEPINFNIAASIPARTESSNQTMAPAVTFVLEGTGSAYPAVGALLTE